METLVLRPTVIADRSLGSGNGNPVGGRWLVSGRWFLRFSKGTNGSIILRSISTSEWIMTLFAMASLIEFVPLLSLCILDPVRKLTHYFRWLNAKEAKLHLSSRLHWATRLLFVTNWTWRYIVHPSLLRMLFLFGWPPCQRSDMTLVEVSQHAYDYLYIRTIVLFVFLRNSCKPDMVLVYIFVE